MKQKQINELMEEGKKYIQGKQNASEYIQKMMNLGLNPPVGTYIVSNPIRLISMG